MKESLGHYKIHPVPWIASRLTFHIRSDLHLARKLWHCLMGLVIVGLYLAGIPRMLGVLILGIFLLGDLTLESLRLKNPQINQRFLKLFGPVLRQHEIQKLSTTPHYLSAAMLVIACLPQPLAVLSLLYLAFGDPFASWMGILYGKKGPLLFKGRSLIGTVSGILICLLISWIYLNTFHFTRSEILLLSCIGSISAGLADLLPWEIDDNFTIPIVSGFSLGITWLALGLSIK